VLLNYNGENIVGAQQFVRLVQETPQGRKVKIQIWRDGKIQTVLVTTGAPQSLFELPPNFVGFSMPDPGVLTTVPDPMLLWKNTLLGLECEPVDSQLAEYFGVRRGVLVRSVNHGSAADRAGIKAGDVVTAIDDRVIATPRDLNSYMRSEHQPGTPMSLSLMRNRKPMTVHITPENPQ
jgi:serine protease Do